MIETIANSFIQRLIELEISDKVHTSKGYLGWIEISINDTVTAFVKHAIGGRGAEIEIPRTLVSKLRSYQVIDCFDSKVTLAAMTFIQIHNKLAAYNANVQARNQEIAHLQPLPMSVRVSRKSEGKFSVSFQKDMDIETLEKFIQYIKTI